MALLNSGWKCHMGWECHRWWEQRTTPHCHGCAQVNTHVVASACHACAGGNSIHGHSRDDRVYPSASKRLRPFSDPLQLIMNVTWPSGSQGVASGDDGRCTGACTHRGGATAIAYDLVIPISPQQPSAARQNTCRHIMYTTHHRQYRWCKLLRITRIKANDMRAHHLT